ncbi:MAG: hypothetical protein IID32_06250 [Planctomycetes bacterium]|nr:hypothetical protein [Planctomycetota bacterium]
MGKTRLAVEFAWWAFNQKKYNTILFVAAESPQRLQAALAEIAVDLLKIADQDLKEELAKNASLQWLTENKNWLIILDNADTKDAAKEVEALLPKLANGHVIITSRYTRWSPAVEPQSLGLLEPDEAQQFLLDRTAKRRTETDQDESIAKDLAKELGYLPLALEQAAAYVAHQKITLTEYLQQWLTQKTAALQWHDEQVMNYPVSVAATFQRTFQQLSPQSRSILHLAAFLAPDPIPIEMFNQAITLVNDSTSLLEENPITNPPQTPSQTPSAT